MKKYNKIYFVYNKLQSGTLKVHFVHKYHGELIYTVCMDVVRWPARNVPPNALVQFLKHYAWLDKVWAWLEESS